VDLRTNSNYFPALLLKVKVFSIQCFPTFEKALLFGRFPGFARLSFWYERRVYEHDYVAMVE
jgi:hypothetical protein